MEAIQLEYAYASDKGLKNLADWIPMSSYLALVRADMLATRIKAPNSRMTWEYLRDDIENRRKELLLALAATHHPLRDVMLDDDAKPQADQAALDIFTQSLLSMPEAIKKHRRLGEEFVTAFQNLTENSS